MNGTSELNSAAGSADVEVLYRLASAGVAEILANARPAQLSAVRGMLTLLEEKGHVRHNGTGCATSTHPRFAPAKARQSLCGSSYPHFSRGRRWLPRLAAGDVREELSAEEEINCRR